MAADSAVPRREPLGQRGAEHCGRLGAVEHAKPVRFEFGSAEVFPAYRVEEAHFLGLEAVRGTRKCAALRGDARRDVEQQREVWLQIGMYPLLERRNALRTQSTAAALIGVGGVGKAIAQYPLASR